MSNRRLVVVCIGWRACHHVSHSLEHLAPSMAYRPSSRTMWHAFSKKSPNRSLSVHPMTTSARWTMRPGRVVVTKKSREHPCRYKKKRRTREPNVMPTCYHFYILQRVVHLKCFIQLCIKVYIYRRLFPAKRRVVIARTW